MKIIGHRGASGLLLENTLPSFLKAQELGVDMIELDVHCLISGELAVHHDIRLERLTDGRGPLKDCDWGELQNYRLSDGSRILLLEEVLEALDPALPINIEMKGLGTAVPTAQAIMRALREGERSYQSFLVSSFNHHELLRFKAELPQLRIGALMSGIPLDCRRLSEGLEPYSLNISHEFVTEEFIREIHEAGMKVFIYTVNYPDQLEQFRAWGVDGVFTDRPDMALNYR